MSLIDESLRTAEHPSIEFRDSAVGRQAHVRGSSLAVWEVTMLAREHGNDVQATATHLDWPIPWVVEALDYARAYPAEIDAAIAENGTSVAHPAVLGTPDSILLSAHSKYGCIDLYATKLVITHKGKKARKTLGERRDEILLSAVTSVFLQEATWFTRIGYIRITGANTLKGKSRSRNSFDVYSALYDPYALIFTRRETAEFAKLHQHIQRLLSEAREADLRRIQQSQHEAEEQKQQRQRDFEEQMRAVEERAALQRSRMEGMQNQNNRLAETIVAIQSLLKDAIATPAKADLAMLGDALSFDTACDNQRNSSSASLIETIVACCALTLHARPPLPDWPDAPGTDKIAYVSESRQLVVEYDLPSFDTVPDTVSLKYVRSADEIKAIIRPVTQRRTLYTSLVAQLTLRVLHDLFMSAVAAYIDTIVFNGYVNSIDAGTGRPIRPCLITVRVTRDRWDQIDLSRVDPVACLKVLNAAVSKSPSELAPVQPVMELAMVDPRFIAQPDVISTLDTRPNLMDLTPSAFEALIANLFEKMGLETRLTQASRDGGVDCVAYDMTPILGGKIVIQAKRYKHTVGVSAVRDLYGTVQNEGASKGILVTTSGYGKAAFDFAQNKPLTLLDGPNLLYLLTKHAGIEAKIEIPDDWIDPTPDMPRDID